MSNVLNKKELVTAIASQTGETEETASSVIDSFFETVGNTIKEGGKVVITGWLSFERGHRAARQGVNPRTGEAIEIAATNTAKVKAGTKLKDKAKGK